jgi:hypothetical protein
VVAISSLYRVPSPRGADAQPTVQLQNMAMDAAVPRRGIGSTVMAEIIRRLQAADAVLL